MTQPSAALEVRRLTKSFAGARALRDVSLTIRPGEVHGLLGENGSGKSTLIKILAGFHAPDAGELEIHGRRVALPLAPGEFRRFGLEFVHQDLGLIPSLTVVENLRLGSVIATPRGRRHVSWRAERGAAHAVFARYGLDLDPGAQVSSLRPVERALLAIVRAVEDMRDASELGGVLVLDEPTVFLPRRDTDHLFTLVRQVAQSASVLFVSHDLDEVREITDRVTVLRDGRNAGTVDSKTASDADLVRLIIGRDLERLERAAEHPPAQRGAPALEVRSLNGTLVRDASFSLVAGEVLGVTGLVGSGFEEVVYLLFGAEAGSGALTLDGEPHDLAQLTPAAAIRAGLSLVPADRQRDGGVGGLSVVDNLTLPVMDGYMRRGKLDRRGMARDARGLMERFDVRPPDGSLTYSALSGGNQQKALLAKWLQTKPRVLLLHEPTQGVDIGARQTIFSLVGAAAAEGTCVVCASSDYDQLAMLCDRVLILAGGRIVRELTGEGVTKDRITEQCFESARAATALVANGG